MKKNLLTLAVCAAIASGNTFAETLWEGSLFVTGWNVPYTVEISRTPITGDILTFNMDNTTNSFAVSAAEGADFLLSSWIGAHDTHSMQLQVTGSVAEMLGGTRSLSFYRGDYTLTSIECQTSAFADQLDKNTVWFAMEEEFCEGWGKVIVPKTVFANVTVNDKVAFHCSPSNCTLTLRDGVNYWGAIFDEGSCVDGVYVLDIASTENPETVVGNLKNWGVIVTGNDFCLNFIDIVPEGESASVSDIMKDDASQQFDIYNACGMVVRTGATSLDNLPSGLYIAKGKKVIVK